MLFRSHLPILLSVRKIECPLPPKLSPPDTPMQCEAIIIDCNATPSGQATVTADNDETVPVPAPPTHFLVPTMPPPTSPPPPAPFHDTEKSPIVGIVQAVEEQITGEISTSSACDNAPLSAVSLPQAATPTTTEEPLPM